MRENSQFCTTRIRLWFFAVPNLREDVLAKVNGSISPNEIVENIRRKKAATTEPDIKAAWRQFKPGFDSVTTF
jgi:hypothetical protein